MTTPTERLAEIFRYAEHDDDLSTELQTECSQLRLIIAADIAADRLCVASRPGKVDYEIGYKLRIAIDEATP